jgi:hypothetical protein
MDEDIVATPYKRPVHRVPVIQELRAMYACKTKQAVKCTTSRSFVKEPLDAKTYQDSALHDEVTRDGLVQPGVVVRTLHEYLFGEVPITDFEWLHNITIVERAIREKWPTANVAYMLMLVAVWLTEMHANAVATSVYTYLYNSRVTLIE